MRINLASGTDIRDGWVNCDIVPLWPGMTRGCEVIWDARKDSLPFKDESVDEVMAGYLFLHLAPQHHDRVLRDIYRVMKFGASLVVGEVDMTVVMQRFLQNPTDISCRELIWGEQGSIHGQDLAEFDKHCHGYTEESLRAFLSSVGLVNLARFERHPGWYDLSIRCTK